jgi:5-hydroxyisourate hydrolase
MNNSPITRRNLIQTGVVASVVASSAQVLAQTQPKATDAQKVAPKSQSGLSPRLTMHAIDTFHGTPGGGMKCKLSVREGDQYKVVKSFTTAPNGRTDDPVLSETELKAGQYELELDLQSYFDDKGVKLPDQPFLTQVPIRFVVRDVTQRHHLPILFTPWGYSYYRGS